VATIEQERSRRQRQLAVAFRALASYGHDEGVAGHISARDPQFADRFWVNPFGMHFAQIRVRDLLLVGADGSVVEGEGKVNPAGFAIHSAIHAARPDVVAAVHAHSVAGRAWSTLGRRLDPLTQDACAFFEDHALFDDFSGVVLDVDEGKRIAAALGEQKAIILRNHGLLTVGQSVAEAAWWFISLDNCCKISLLAEAAGSPVSIGADDARGVRATIGTPQIGAFGFRPLYQKITSEQPDVLD
jgi:ribulose-5-phosphate 4-epimerase/fuculose-1-phosphate aldolase